MSPSSILAEGKAEVPQKICSRIQQDKTKHLLGYSLNTPTSPSPPHHSSHGQATGCGGPKGRLQAMRHEECCSHQQQPQSLQIPGNASCQQSVTLLVGNSRLVGHAIKRKTHRTITKLNRTLQHPIPLHQTSAVSVTMWLFNIAMERSTIFKFGKPSISMGHLYHGYVTNNQRVL